MLKKIAVLLAPAAMAVSLSMVPIAVTAPAASAKLVEKCPPGTTNPIYCHKVFVCPHATGRLKGTKLGLTKLAERRAALRKAYIRAGSKISKHAKFRDLFCLSPFGVRVGYGSPGLLRGHRKALKKKYRGRVVEALTSNKHYANHGIRPGATQKAAQKKFRNANVIHVGLNLWLVAHGSPSTAVFKCRHGKVSEVGIAAASLTVTKAQQLKFIKSFR